MVIEPGRSVLDRIPKDMMDDSSTRDIVLHAFLDGGQQVGASNDLAPVRRSRIRLG